MREDIAEFRSIVSRSEEQRRNEQVKSVGVGSRCNQLDTTQAATCDTPVPCLNLPNIFRPINLKQ